MILNVRICTMITMIMVCLMNMSTQTIFSKLLNTNKRIIKSCYLNLMILVALSTFRLITSCVFYNLTLIPAIIYNLRDIFVYYIPFMLMLLSMRQKNVLVIIPIYVEVVSIIVSVKFIYQNNILPIYGILVIMVSTVYLIMMLSKYNKIMSIWNFGNAEMVMFSEFLKNFIWGILLGIVVFSWLGMIYSSDIDNQIIFGILMIVGGLSLITVVVLFYLIPTIIAVKRKHLQKVPIILVNILLGWSLLGWIVSLVWACMQNNPKVIHINNKGTDGLGEKLQVLEKLCKDGLITDEEYEIKKSELLKKY